MGGILNPGSTFGGNGTSPGSITTKGDTNYTILPTDRVVAINAVFTAARTWTLPAANSLVAGNSLFVVDLANALTRVNTLTVQAAGADLIVGGTTTFASFTLIIPGFGVQLISDGTSKWVVPTSTIAVGSGHAASGFGGAANYGLGLDSDGNTSAPIGISTGSGTLFLNSGSNGHEFDRQNVAVGKFDSNGNFITIKATADQSKSVQTPITGFTITIANNISSLILTPAGTLASGTINLPATPIDGQIVRISSTQTITALTVSGNGNTISNAPTALTISATGSYGFAYIFHLATTTWLRLE